MALFNTMFDSVVSEKPASSLEECSKKDSIANNLWSYTLNIEKWGKILFFLVLIFGLISSIAESWQAAQQIGINYWGTEETEIDWGIFFSGFFFSMLLYIWYAIIEYFVYHVVALLLGALAGIYQNTRQTAKIAEYQARIAGGSKVEEPKTEKKTAPEAVTFTSVKKDPTASSDSKPWNCRYCKAVNPAGTYECSKCGKIRS